MSTTAVPFFIGQLVRTTHLTAEEADLGGLDRLLEYRTRDRTHHMCDDEVGLMALVAAYQLGMDGEQLFVWAGLWCQNVLGDVSLTGKAIELVRSAPSTLDETSCMRWFGDALATARKSWVKGTTCS